MFAAEREDDPEHPTETVYGTLTARPGLQVRVIERPPLADDEAEEDEPKANVESEASP